MSHRGVFASIVIPLAFLTACTTADLTRLEATALPEQPFEASLAAHYRSFAIWEAAQYDWPDSQHFARKGLRVAAGEVTEPEPLAAWRLPDGALDALARSRRRLVALFDGGARQRAPELAAKAQFLFDCWVEQQEENWQVAHIAACRDGLDSAFAQLQAATPEGTPNLVYFDFDKSALSPAAERVLYDVAREASRLGAAAVAVAGHTDRAGRAAYNRRLSRARADAVVRFLAAQGVDAARIEVRALGETQPRRVTDDGVREPENRRAEVRLRLFDDPVAMVTRLWTNPPRRILSGAGHRGDERSERGRRHVTATRQWPTERR